MLNSILLKMREKIVLILFVVLVIPEGVFAQGCSDAGFCTVSTINPSSNLDTINQEKSYFKTGLTVGSSQYNVTAINPYLEYDFSIHKKVILSTKGVYSIRTGPVVTTNSLSDLFFSLNYRISTHFSTVVAVKVPLNKADFSEHNRDLPMSYQTSLGTTDFIYGISFSRNNFFASLGTQIPLTQNSNQFLIEEYVGELNLNYLSTNNFKRQPDVLLRLNYQSKWNNNLKLIYGILPIFHIANDKYTNSLNERKEIRNSKGLTLNLNSILQYQLNQKNVVEFSVGIPIISRKSRPDGLPQFAVGIQYGIKF